MKWYIALFKAKVICLFNGHDYYWRPISAGKVCKRCAKLKGVIEVDKKKMIEMAISMLQEVEPETIEVVNFDRTEYDDGSVGFSVNLTTPPEKKDYIGPQGIYLGGCTVAKYADPANGIEIEKVEDIEADKLHFTHNQRYFVLDLSEPDLEEKAITLHCGYKKAYMTDHVQTEYVNLTHGVRGTEES